MKPARIKVITIFSYLNDIHINKDPLLYPITFKKMGMESIFITSDNQLTKKRNIPRIIVLRNRQPKSVLRGIRSYLNYMVEELKYGKEISDIVKNEKPNIVIYYRDPISAFIVKLFNPNVNIVWKVEYGGEIEDLPFPKFIVNLSFMFKYLISSVLITESADSYGRLIKFAPYLKGKMKLIPNGIPKNFTLFFILSAFAKTISPL